MHVHEFCEELHKAVVKDNIFGENATINGMPRVCPRSCAHSCQVSTKVEWESELPCKLCLNPDSDVEQDEQYAQPNREMSQIWLSLEKKYSMLSHNSLHDKRYIARMLIWRREFKDFQEEERIRNPPEEERAVEYDPLDRNGFLRDVQVSTLPPDSDCGICQSSLLEDDPVLLPCHHTYHLYCINAWLGGVSFEDGGSSRYTCPTCRREYNLCRALDASFHPGRRGFSHLNDSIAEREDDGDSESSGDEEGNNDGGSDHDNEPQEDRMFLDRCGKLLNQVCEIMQSYTPSGENFGLLDDWYCFGLANRRLEVPVSDAELKKMFKNMNDY